MLHVSRHAPILAERVREAVFIHGAAAFRASLAPPPSMKGWVISPTELYNEGSLLLGSADVCAIEQYVLHSTKLVVEELPRTPSIRSSQNTYSKHSAE